ncbi:MAG: sortase [Candidatus Gottesmanbacteria bacterium]
MKNLPKILTLFGFLSILTSGIILIFTFYPVFNTEINYEIKSVIKPFIKQSLKPIDTDFGIVILKIDANSKIVANVDPYNSKEYQWALTKGVAHARGSSFPGELGNVFIFSHSSVNFYEAVRYNSIFYLLNKLEKGDEIDLYYKDKKFKYLVNEKKMVNSGDIQYLSGKNSDRTVTLMTCWPPGTDLKRLIVIADYSSIN